jgi:predicted Zn-dependent protease
MSTATITFVYVYSNVVFNSGVIGKAQRSTMCSYKQSGGVDMDHSRHALAVAATVAHEMGHNFGADHDNDSCQCASDRCIMAPMTGYIVTLTLYTDCV